MCTTVNVGAAVVCSSCDRQRDNPYNDAYRDYCDAHLLHLSKLEQQHEDRSLRIAGLEEEGGDHGSTHDESLQPIPIDEEEGSHTTSFFSICDDHIREAYASLDSDGSQEHEEGNGEGNFSSMYDY